MARLFIAIELPEHVKDELIRLQDQIRERFARELRFAPRENLHLTLKFLGRTPEERVPEVKRALHEAARGATPFTLRVSSCGVFPARGAARVIFAGANDHSELTLCHHLVETSCAEIGFEREKRPFSPHITLARVEHRGRRDLRAFGETLALRACELQVTQLALFHSRTLPAGSAYELIERVGIGLKSPKI